MEKVNGTEIRQKLESLAEPDYRAFHSSLVPGEEHILGVRLPKMRALARELARKDWIDWFLERKDTCYEETMVRGLVLAYARIDTEERIHYISLFLKDITNWAVCDSFCNTLKDADRYQEIYWSFLEPYFTSEQEYEVRFAAVMLLSHFVTEHYLEDSIRRIERISHQGYYARMAAAWAVSVFFAAFPEKMLPYLQGKNDLDEFIYQKALQKITESYRVSKEMKCVISEMKQKGHRNGNK